MDLGRLINKPGSFLSVPGSHLFPMKSFQERVWKAATSPFKAEEIQRSKKERAEPGQESRREGKRATALSYAV